MAFFPRNIYNADSSFTPLFRLLDDFDNYSRQTNGQPTNNGRRSAAFQHWQPKFDVREVAEAYELHGELPGMSKENVHIEFTEPQTMLIRGKVERTYSTGTAPHGAIEDATASGAITENGEEHKNSSGSSHRATVEDENEAAAHEVTSQEVVKQPQQEQKPEEKKPVDRAKYWLTERSIGEFSRSFNFPTRVDQENVTATMENGILSITVPKAKKHEARRITIN